MLDTSKADTLGPLAKVFGSILASISANRKDILPFTPDNQIDLFRGALLTKAQVKEHRDIKKMKNP